MSVFPRPSWLLVATVVMISCGPPGARTSVTSSGASRSPEDSAAPPVANRYSFEVIAQLDTPAPRGGNFINDFEIQAINDNGEVFFGTDLACGEGLFIARQGVGDRGRRVRR
jgi:hypothetical protein